ncbi:ABC transporter substrate-binding protein [Pseudorhodoferax sp. Leaf274]|uniref:ABC transporter substrate-binding protein n=1 Tax=Pseudorhodoferax sp. Leaf274 TaxID=1736318 RepID=UPI000703A87D|nr:ABC transporter substrate-binding protein [Pseudorhodoferax sp. Leaf274]KQP35323.1 ABC transporter substrate-binding protein [Pseudorhodoferax sp. Leaf274]
MQTPAFRRRCIVAAGLAGAAWVAAPALRAQEKPERTRLTLAVGGKATFYYLPLTIAEQLGYFKAEGLDVVVEDHAAGGHAMQAVLSGTADIGAGPFESLVLLRSRNLAYQSFVLQGRAPQIAMGVSTRTLAQYQGLASLRGRSIGVSAPGTSTQMVAQLLLARAGVKPHEARFVGVGTGAEALATLRAGELDAMSNTEPVMTMLEQHGDVRIVADTRTLKGSQDLFGGNMPAACLYASTAFIATQPRVCQALAHAIVHALKWLQTAGPGDIVRTVPENYLLGDRALYLASFQKVRDTISPDGLVPEDGGATALRTLASFDADIDSARIDPARLFTNAFARKAKERFKL